MKSHIILLTIFGLLLIGFIVTIFTSTVPVIVDNQPTLLELVNIERSKTGIKPLTYDQRLLDSAIVKVNDLIDNNYWSHNRPNGEKFSINIYDHIPKATIVGENLARCFDTVDKTFKGLNNSPGHHANIVNDKYTLYGDATASGNGCSYVVQHFATE